MSLRLHRAPWSHFCGEDGVDVSPDAEMESLPSSGVRLFGTPPAGLQCNGRSFVPCSPELDGGGRHWDVAYPNTVGSHAALSFKGGGRAWSMDVANLPSRALVAEREADPCERWLLWQSYRYLRLSGDDELSGTESQLSGGGARRDWSSVIKLWQEGDEGAARMSLIVQMARRSSLIQAIRSIERNPRRMLLRTHKPRKVSRIDEMDPATLRAYAQAPGRTPAQKAGPRQELLAVVREDTVDLPENRVFLWLVQRLRSMARSWYSQHHDVQDHGGFAKRVKALGTLAQKAERSEQLVSVGALSHHLHSPTYCLQFDRRYRQIWKAYREIRTQDQMMDDAFRWQPRLWATTSRLLLAALLQDKQGAGWKEDRLSTPYFRAESVCGEWLQGPSIPGPFVAGDMGRCHVVDLRSDGTSAAHTAFGLPKDAYESGAECILVWPDRCRLCLVWTAVVSKVDDGLVGKDALSRRLTALDQAEGWRWSGLVMRADPGQAAEQSEWVAQDGRLCIMRIPRDMHAYWGDLGAGLNLALEEVLR